MSGYLPKGAKDLLPAMVVRLPIWRADVRNLKYQLLAEHLREEPEVAVTYFCPDARKSGGAYVTVDGTVQKIDLDGRRIVMADGTAIALDDILDIAGALFAVLP